MSERVFNAFTRRATAAIARLASERPSRRDISAALIGVPLAGMWGSLFGDDAGANRKRRRRRKRRKRKNKKK